MVRIMMSTLPPLSMQSWTFLRKSLSLHLLLSLQVEVKVEARVRTVWRLG